MTERVDMYRSVHKGIRRLLSALLAQAGTTDFADQAEVAALEAAMHDAFALLASHARHEDAFIMPLARPYDAALIERLDVEHHGHEAAFSALEARIRAIREGRAEGPRTGHELVVALSRLAAELMQHMADEEERVQPLLWRTHDDATLARVEGELVASIAPPTLMAFLAHMIPAMSAPERVGFVRNMAQGAPPEAVRGVLELARSVLTSADMARLEGGVADVVPAAA